jgi:hypothetical protein
MLSVVLLNSLKQLAPQGMFFSNPDNTISVLRCSDAFVDNAQNGLNNFGKLLWDAETLQLKLQQMSQTWERLLFNTGGALEPSKCFYYLIHWQWHKGLPSMTPLSCMTLDPLKLTSGWKTEQVAIRQRNVDDAHKTLGVLSAISSNEFSLELLSVT